MSIDHTKVCELPAVLPNKQVSRPDSKRYLLCPAALTIRHLKKLISSKLDVTPEYQVCLLPSCCFLPNRIRPYPLANHMSVGWAEIEQCSTLYALGNQIRFAAVSSLQ